MLDLSHPPTQLTKDHLKSLLQPAATRLPSLRVLGLRGIVDTSFDTLIQAGEAGLSYKADVAGGSSDRTCFNADLKRGIIEIIRESRQRYITVDWG
jgi:hypothetical protein